MCSINTFTAERVALETTRKRFAGRVDVSPKPSDRVKLLRRIIPISPRRRRMALTRMILEEENRRHNINLRERSKSETDYSRISSKIRHADSLLDAFYGSRTFAREHEAVTT